MTFPLKFCRCVGRIASALLAMVMALAAGGCHSASNSRDFSVVPARFHLEAAGTDGIPLKLPRSGVGVVVNPKPVLTETDIANVELVRVDLGQCLLFQLTPVAARDFYRLSVTHQGRRLVVLLDGVMLGARRLDGVIANGGIYMFVELPDEALPGLVEKLKASSAGLQRERARK
jgi:hypothetical protein